MSLRWKDWLHAPIWPLEVFTGRKQFGGNPILGSAWLNRKGLHVFRVKLAHRLADRRRGKLAHLISDEDRTAYHKQGYVALENFLDPAQFAQLQAEVLALTGPEVQFIEGSTRTRKIKLTPAILNHNPALARLVVNDRFQGLMRYISSFDTEPYLCAQAIETHINDKDFDPQNSLHIDTFHPTMKAWFFIEDVEPEKGPFSYIPGSHKPTAARLAWHKQQSILKATKAIPDGGSFRLTQDDLTRLGLPAPKQFAVPANSLVVGDTFGVHARTRTDKPTTRIEIWAFSRETPFWPFTVPPMQMIPGAISLQTRVLAILRRLTFVPARSGDQVITDGTTLKQRRPNTPA